MDPVTRRRPRAGPARRPGRHDPHLPAGDWSFDQWPRLRRAPRLKIMVEQLPQDVLARLRALDPAITPELAEASWALLTPFHEKLGYTAPWIARDLKYGEHERHRLDVHAGAEPAGAESGGDGAGGRAIDNRGAP